MIVPVKYLAIEIDSRTFNRIIRFIVKSVGGNSDLKMSIEEFNKVYVPDTDYEFVRLKHEDYYIDIKLSKLSPCLDFVTLSFGPVIDYNRTHFISKPKTK